jgi:hypothetical protein
MSTIEENQRMLANVNSQNIDVNNTAAQINQYTEMCKNNQITREEYAQLLQDIQSQININAHMIEQQNLIMMNTAINGLINIAKLAA